MIRKLSIAVIVITSPNIRVQTLSYTSEGNKTGQFTPLYACPDIYFAKKKVLASRIASDQVCLLHACLDIYLARVALPAALLLASAPLRPSWE